MSGLTKMFGGGSTPTPPPPPPVPTSNDAANSAAAMAATKRAQANAGGYDSTILTSSKGDLSTPNVGKKTLLGN